MSGAGVNVQRNSEGECATQNGSCQCPKIKML